MKTQQNRIIVALLAIPLMGLAGMTEHAEKHAPVVKPMDSQVMVSGRKILVNGSPYLIKGICYHPVPKGSEDVDMGRLAGDLELMAEAGINTLRVYTPIDDQNVLDAIHAAGLKLIIGFGYNQNGAFDIRTGTYIDYVKKHKNHPAVLMWELGNEYNYHPEWFGGDIGHWYRVLNQAAELIQQHDSSHPVATSHGDLPDSSALASCPNVDVWGMNVYRWDNPETIFPEWAAISGKPMYLSEAGADSYMSVSRNGYRQGENQKAQADANRKILNDIFRHQDICAGVSLFSFSDGWWKAGDPNNQDPGGTAPNSSGVPYDSVANEEYWGIVDVDRKKKLSFEVIKESYTAQTPGKLAPTLSSTTRLYQDD